jgi:LDH2 family malate/lactate/ureidoglycolate dehydrogenase
MKRDVDLIEKLVTEAFVNSGCDVEEATINANSLLMTEMCGVTSHGLRMVSSHVSKYNKHVYSYASPLKIEFQNETFARIDSNGMCGLYSAMKCMEYAISKAKDSGIYTVFAHNCNTLGAAFIYTLEAAKKGFIGLVICNTPAQMAPLGGRHKILGTNPLSYAIPVLNSNPIVYDAAMSAVAKSKINLAVERGEDIPLGWAVDSNGLPTTNAKAAQEGSVLPMAGPKGYGIALFIDILAGMLSGAKYLDSVGRFYNSDRTMDVGQVFVAINPKLIYGESFLKEMLNYVTSIRTSSEGYAPTLPGDRKWEHYENSKNEGIYVNDELLSELQDLAHHGK